MFDLRGKTALVTGASGGIGFAIASLLANRGARVGLHGTNRDKLLKTASDIKGDTVVMPADLSLDSGVDQLLIDVAQSLGGVDILVNNAGITRDMLAMRLKDDDWDAVLQVNLKSSFRLIRGCLKPMMKKRYGRIISITSVVGTTGNPGQANYAASKAGLVAMSKSIAQEVASRGITLNCVAPGFIQTAMTDSLTDDQKAALTTKIPSATLGEPDDIAAGVVYLASDEARYVTGQTLHINGGLTMI